MKQLGSRGKSICRDSADGPQETVIDLITNLHEVIRMIGLVMVSTPYLDELDRGSLVRKGINDALGVSMRNFIGCEVLTVHTKLT